MKTFSVGFVEASAANELDDARPSRSALGTEHHELRTLVRPTTPIDLPDLLWHLDEPIADLSTLGFYALSSSRESSHGRALRAGGGRAARRLRSTDAASLRRVAVASCGLGRASASRSRLVPAADAADATARRGPPADRLLR